MQHIGIDVHQVSSQLCFVDENGEIREKRIRTERKPFRGGSGRLSAFEGPDRGLDRERMGRSVQPKRSPMYAIRARVLPNCLNAKENR